MRLLKYIEYTNLHACNEAEKAKMLCFYRHKETGDVRFTMPVITQLLLDCGYNKPNTSRLRDKLTKGKTRIFLPVKGSNTEFEFIPAILQSLDREFGVLWVDTETISSDSELIDEKKFCGKRNYLTRLIQQINSCYKNNCYDACAVLMRRLFEVTLILAYQNLKIEDEIKFTDGRYCLLEAIVNNAKGNATLNLSSRVRKDLDNFREVGNLSAHSITYTAGQKDINDISLNYRVMLDELFNKAGLL